jgi:hypothetical protein
MLITDNKWRKETISRLRRAINVDITDANYPWMVRTYLRSQRREVNADGTKRKIDMFGLACVGSIINYSRYILLLIFLGIP